MMRLLAPIRHGAWTSGTMGQEVERHLRGSLDGLRDVRVARVMGGYVINVDENEVCAVSRVTTALQEAEAFLCMSYPAFYTDLGPLFTGEIQAVLDCPPWAGLRSRDRGRTLARPTPSTPATEVTP